MPELVVSVLLEPGARLAGAFAARLLKLSRDRVAFAAVLQLVSLVEEEEQNTYFSLITATIPAWQCFPCEQ